MPAAWHNIFLDEAWEAPRIGSTFFWRQTANDSAAACRPTHLWMDGRLKINAKEAATNGNMLFLSLSHSVDERKGQDKSEELEQEADSIEAKIHDCKSYLRPKVAPPRT